MFGDRCKKVRHSKKIKLKTAEDILVYISIAILSQIRESFKGIFQKFFVILCEYGLLFFFCFNQVSVISIFGIYSAIGLVIVFDYSVYLKEKPFTLQLITSFALRATVKSLICLMAYLFITREFGKYDTIPIFQ